MWKPDTTKFKVICQKCGHVGTVDFHTDQTQDFFREDTEVGDYGCYTYYLCGSCETTIRDHEQVEGKG